MSRVRFPAHWEQLASAAPSAAPMGIAASQVLLAFMRSTAGRGLQLVREGKAVAAAAAGAGSDPGVGKSGPDAERETMSTSATATSSGQEEGLLSRERQLLLHGPALAVRKVVQEFGLSGIFALNQSIKTQDQQCQWPNKPRPQTQGS